ncbi:MAG TPA: M3 family metallopeptidase [Acidimicrobiia bacterium]|nr:M3 family metallopeptidase [Acidimicrobiia bacterium]
MHFPSTPEQVAALVDEAIADADTLVDRLVGAEERTWETTLAPLDAISDRLEQAYGRGPFMGYVHPDAEVRTAARQAEERIQQWAVELIFRDDLYEAVTEYAATEDAVALEGEKARLLSFVRRDLRRAGHELGPDVRAEVKRLTQRLVELGVAFETNIAEHEDALVLTSDDLAGLPENYVERLTPGDEEGTYKVTMAYPDVVPFMENSERRDLRQQLSFKFNTRAIGPNRAILEEAVRLRARIAELFGEPSWAHYQLEERMAREPATVTAFYKELVPALTKAGLAEIEEMRAMLAEDTGEPDAVLQLWDWRYYHTRLSRERHGVDPNEVADYLPIDSVLDGLFDVTGDVFGLDYETVDLETWHPDVTSYAIRDRADGKLIAHFHMDLYPREGKFSHAAAFTMVPGRRLPDGSYQTPVSAIVANFTKPSPTRPSLLQHQEVETLFHEFGHILHQVLTRAELVRFSGSSTERDFVEAPSQIMEHWTWRPEVLARFARHHETNEPFPAELIEAMVAARNLNIAVTNLRQVQFGVLDMGLHGEGAAQADIDQLLRDATAVALLPFHEGTFFPASWGHMLSGYDAGYYGYLWSEVYGDDMFSRFDEEGVTDPKVGAEYRRAILEAGGTRDGLDLLRAFLGREPSNAAFLRKLGIAG